MFVSSCPSEGIVVVLDGGCTHRCNSQAVVAVSSSPPSLALSCALGLCRRPEAGVAHSVLWMTGKFIKTAQGPYEKNVRGGEGKKNPILPQEQLNEPIVRSLSNNAPGRGSFTYSHFNDVQMEQILFGWIFMMSKWSSFFFLRLNKDFKKDFIVIASLCVLHFICLFPLYCHKVSDNTAVFSN